MHLENGLYTRRQISKNDRMKTTIIRPSILMAGIFVLGFLCGGFWTSVFNRNIEVEVNLVRLKCLYSLAEDYKKATGRWPKHWEEFRLWCEPISTRKMMFGMARRACARNSTGSQWVLMVDGKGEFAGFESVSYSSLHHDYHMKADGSVSVVKKEE